MLYMGYVGFTVPFAFAMAITPTVPSAAAAPKLAVAEKHMERWF